MNKKVLTLCAGFLLAGSMFSSLSAKKLSEVAGDGNYYKLQRVQYHDGSDWQTDASERFLDANGDAFGIAEKSIADDYWTVIDLGGGVFQLRNLAGQYLNVAGETKFTEYTVASYTQLQIGGSDYVANQADATIIDFYPLVKQSSIILGTTGYGDAFDAQETSLSLIPGYGYDVVENDSYYTIICSEGVVRNGIQFKATVKDGKASFASNDEADTDPLNLGGTTSFTLVAVGGVSGQYLLQVNNQYVKYISATESKLVDSMADATIFAFDKVDGMTQLTVDDLVYYDLDAFTLNIYYDADKKTVAGDPFKGRLTPMSYVFGRMVPAADDASAFYLKNEAGEYIVAKLWSKGNTAEQDVYTFTTVKENELLHYLSNFNDDKDPAYYGYFSAHSYNYKQDKQKLDVLDKLEVSLPTGDAIVSRYEINDVWTLAASVETDMADVTVAINPVTLVQAKNFLRKNFVTVTKTATTNPMGTKGNIAVTENGKAGVVASYGNVLEGQWAITLNPETNVYTFTNRENQAVSFTLDGNRLYTADEANTYRLDIYTNGVYQYTDTYVIENVQNAEWSDGYETRKNLKNVKFNIGYSSETFKGNAWFTENHEGTNNHTIGLDIDQENALTFTATEYAAAKKKVETPVHGYAYMPSDSIYVISHFGYIDGNGNYKADALDTLKVVSYSFVNQWGEPLVYDGVNKYVSSTNKNIPAQKFVLRKDGEKLNLRPVTLDQTPKYSATAQLYNKFNNGNDLQKMYSGDTSNGILNNTGLYSRTENDRFVVESTDVPMYRRIVNGIDTISIYRSTNDKEVLFEDGVNSFLGLKNAVQFDINPAMLVDTAYVPAETYRPQYLLAVGAVKHGETKWCPEHGFNSGCPHEITLPGWIEGRYLVNLKDTAIAWDKANKHSDANPYINSEKYYRLGFVQAKHIGDSLIIASSNDTLNVGTEDFNVAKFAFRYVDPETKTFVIETANYNRLNEYFTGAQNGEAYIKWMNGVIVAVNDINDADIFNMNEDEDRNPTANETIAAGNVVVAGVNGAVVVKGAEGKNVIVSTILGKVVANEVVSSDNAQISAPAGIVVVSVDGESFKVVVK